MGVRHVGARAPRPVLAAALALAAFVACAGGRAAAPEEDASASGRAWQVDARGRRYTVRALEKRLAVRVGPHEVRTTWGVPLDLEREDAAHWHYRVYETPVPADSGSEAGRPARRAAGAGAAEEAEAAAAAALPTSAALRFERAGAGLPAEGQWRDGFDLADVDGDGRVDLVHGPPRKGRPAPRLFLGDGRGGFRAWREARLPRLPYDYGDARAGDLDGDGDLDLVLASHVRGLVALLGDGRGGFARAGAGLDFAESGPAAFSSRAIRLVDFDGDGRLDVLALGEGPRLASPARAGAAGADGRAVLGGAQGLVLYRGLGDGRFERRDQGTDAAQVFGRSVAVADFDGDGRADAATASGQLGRRDLVHLGRDGGWTSAPVDALRPHAYVLAVAAADFDRDGRAELAVGYAALAGHAWRSGLDVLARGEDGGWRRAALAASEGALGPQALAAGDLDRDGAPDLVALDGAGRVEVFRGDGRGGFTREASPPAPFPGACRGAHVAIADLDGDGFGDVVASFAQERVTGAEPDACPGEGGLASWRTLPAR